MFKNTQLSFSQELTQRNTNTPVEITLRVTVPQLKWHFGGFAIQRKQVIRERRRGWTRWQRFVVFSLYTLRLLLVLSLSHGDEAAQPPVVLDELDGVNGEAAGLRGDVQHGGGTGFVRRGLVQWRILDFHCTELTLKEVKGAAVGLVRWNWNLAPISQHLCTGHLSALSRRLPNTVVQRSLVAGESAKLWTATGAGVTLLNEANYNCQESCRSVPHDAPGRSAGP